MRTLAELAFEYIWLMSDPDEDVIDEDYAQDIHETLPACFESMSEEEKQALKQVAKLHYQEVQANPRKYNFSSSQLDTLEALASGRAFDEW